MKYRQLGRWGIQLSTVGLGSWLTYGNAVDKAGARECIKRAYECGINFFDTANVYARGRAEEVVGKALADYPRSSVAIATKVYFPMGNGPNDRGLSRKHVFEQLHASLGRLRVDYIDLYQCHRYDENTPLEETCGVMNDLIRQGKVLYWGVSEWSADQISEAVEIALENGWAVPVSNQPEYSALWRKIEKDVLPTCEQLGLGNVVWSPLAQGILTGKYTSVDKAPSGSRAAGEQKKFMAEYFTQPILDAVAELKTVAEGIGASTSQLALAWCLRQPQVTSVIVGATKPKHVDDNAGAADLELPDDVVAEMDRILAPFAKSD